MASLVSHSASQLQQKLVLATLDLGPFHLYKQCHVVKIKVFRKPRAEISELRGYFCCRFGIFLVQLMGDAVSKYSLRFWRGWLNVGYLLLEFKTRTVYLVLLNCVWSIHNICLIAEACLQPWGSFVVLVSSPGTAVLILRNRRNKPCKLCATLLLWLEWDVNSCSTLDVFLWQGLDTYLWTALEALCMSGESPLSEGALKKIMSEACGQRNWFLGTAG